MIAKSDLLLLLNELKNEGVDVNGYIQETLRSQNISIDILKFINKNKPLDVLDFYEKLRKSYNDKRSKLYINIMNYLI